MIELDDETRSIIHQGRSVKLAPLEYTFVKWMLEKQWRLDLPVALAQTALDRGIAIYAPPLNIV